MKSILSLLFLLSVCSSFSAKKQPNVLFLFTDDHATQALSAYGHGLNKTPNLDRLATQGMRFTRNYCGNAVCAPSRCVSYAPSLGASATK